MTHRRYGFTLVEMLAVMVILAIAAAATLTLLVGTSITTISLDSATQSVAADIMYAQSQAITTQKKVYVVFTPGDAAQPDQYALRSDTGAVIIRPGGASGTVTMGHDGTHLPGARLGLTGPLKIGFDASGQPFTVSGSTETALTSIQEIRLNAIAANATSTLCIQPFTGDIMTR